MAGNTCIESKGRKKSSIACKIVKVATNNVPNVKSSCLGVRSVCIESIGIVKV